MEPWKAKLTSRKFLLSIGVIVVTVLNQTLELGMDNAAIATLAASAAAWIFGETALDRERISADQQVAFRTLQAEASEVVERLNADLKRAVEIINNLSPTDTGPEATSSDLSDV